MASSNSFQVAAWSLRPSDPNGAENSNTTTPSANTKYHSIVKLQIKYANQDSNDPRYAQGTGWLVKPDLLVTAGHNAFDHTYQFGRAVEVKAFLGYTGEISIGQPGVELRHGNRIVTSSKWISRDPDRANDVSFIELDSPFNDFQSSSFPTTPFTSKRAPQADFNDVDEGDPVSGFKELLGTRFSSYLGAFDQQFPAPEAGIVDLTVGGEECLPSEALDTPNTISREVVQTDAAATDSGVPVAAIPFLDPSAPTVAAATGGDPSRIQELFNMDPQAESGIADRPVSSRPLGERPILGEASLIGLVDAEKEKPGFPSQLFKKESEADDKNI